MRCNDHRRLVGRTKLGCAAQIILRTIIGPRRLIDFKMIVLKTNRLRKATSYCNCIHQVCSLRVSQFFPPCPTQRNKIHAQILESSSSRWQVFLLSVYFLGARVLTATLETHTEAPTSIHLSRATMAHIYSSFQQPMVDTETVSGYVESRQHLESTNTLPLLAVSRPSGHRVKQSCH